MRVRKKGIFVVVLLAMVLTISSVTGYYWFKNKYYVETDNANVSGTIVKVSPQVTGRLLEVYVDEGDMIRAGDIIARLDDTALPPSTNVSLTVVKAPITGTVLKKAGNVGETATPGAAIVMMADLNDLHIVANVDETDLSKVRLGQRADLTVDGFPGVKFSGEVYSLGDAANSVFSLLPSQNTGGNYTKVVQKVPVKISIDDAQDCKLLPGMNAFVRIHVR